MATLSSTAQHQPVVQYEMEAGGTYVRMGQGYDGLP